MEDRSTDGVIHTIVTITPERWIKMKKVDIRINNGIFADPHHQLSNVAVIVGFTLNANFAVEAINEATAKAPPKENSPPIQPIDEKTVEPNEKTDAQEAINEAIAEAPPNENSPPIQPTDEKTVEPNEKSDAQEPSTSKEVAEESTSCHHRCNVLKHSSSEDYDERSDTGTVQDAPVDWLSWKAKRKYRKKVTANTQPERYGKRKSASDRDAFFDRVSSHIDSDDTADSHEQNPDTVNLIDSDGSSSSSDEMVSIRDNDLTSSFDAIGSQSPLSESSHERTSTIEISDAQTPPHESDSESVEEISPCDRRTTQSESNDHVILAKLDEIFSRILCIEKSPSTQQTPHTQLTPSLSEVSLATPTS
ncbi:fibrous sheath CABYR-binding protein-like [Sitodiplosis mosellana]|uniref:fibrous sheath CABYR-binding protein-like n=1 Tax=Sitodiplosis mosellana TaxID=263140 RepID=UPI00244444D1|nr:fibrous sheath CABYR-binding protein-like [Sitodiplosis mosellana]